jgi:hypothetical protein
LRSCFTKTGGRNGATIACASSPDNFALTSYSQSDQGERTIERLLSASVTCRLRKRSLYDYLTQVITTHARGDPIPHLA